MCGPFSWHWASNPRSLPDSHAKQLNSHERGCLYIEMNIVLVIWQLQLLEIHCNNRTREISRFSLFNDKWLPEKLSALVQKSKTNTRNTDRQRRNVALRQLSRPEPEEFRIVVRLLKINKRKNKLGYKRLLELCVSEQWINKKESACYQQLESNEKVLLRWNGTVVSIWEHEVELTASSFRHSWAILSKQQSTSGNSIIWNLNLSSTFSDWTPIATDHRERGLQNWIELESSPTAGR